MWIKKTQNVLSRWNNLKTIFDLVNNLKENITTKNAFFLNLIKLKKQNDEFMRRLQISKSKIKIVWKLRSSLIHTLRTPMDFIMSDLASDKVINSFRFVNSHKKECFIWNWFYGIRSLLRSPTTDLSESNCQRFHETNEIFYAIWFCKTVDLSQKLFLSSDLETMRQTTYVWCNKPHNAKLIWSIWYF